MHKYTLTNDNCNVLQLAFTPSLSGFLDINFRLEFRICIFKVCLMHERCLKSFDRMIHFELDLFVSNYISPRPIIWSSFDNQYLKWESLFHRKLKLLVSAGSKSKVLDEFFFLLTTSDRFIFHGMSRIFNPTERCDAQVRLSFLFRNVKIFGSVLYILEFEINN